MGSYQETLDAVLWVTHTLFQKGLVSGSTGNISFLHEKLMYISQSGSCFGRMDQDSFAIVDLNGKVLHGTPSKEYPLHLSIYKKNKQHQAVIHTHSLYAAALSCRADSEKAIQELFCYTPYLKMQTKGHIKSIAYEKPGSEALFARFQAAVEEDTNLYLLRNHGIVIASADVEAAFSIVEEFEVSANLVHLLRSYHKDELQTIE